MAEASQTVFGPHRPHLFVGRKLATGGGGFRAGDNGLFFGRERRRRFIIRAGEPKNDMSDVVLRVRGKTTCGFECLIEKFSHHAWAYFHFLCSYVGQEKLVLSPADASAGRVARLTGLSGAKEKSRRSSLRPLRGSLCKGAANPVKFHAAVETQYRKPSRIIRSRKFGTSSRERDACGASKAT